MPKKEFRGVCIACGGPTVKVTDLLSGRSSRVCERCSLPSRDCKCVPVTKDVCPDCGERIGSSAPEGITYRGSLTEPHRCRRKPE